MEAKQKEFSMEEFLEIQNKFFDMQRFIIVIVMLVI
jgi:hypothetical protein